MTTTGNHIDKLLTLEIAAGRALFNTHKDKSNGIVALFSHKMAFLKSKFKDDPVRVQRHTVRHFKDFE